MMTDTPSVRPLPFHVRVLMAGTGLWFLLCLPQVTNAGASLPWVCLLAPLTVAVVGFWVYSLVQLADAGKRDRRAVKAWCGCTLLGLLIALGTFTPVGLTARVWLSAAALERLARDLPPVEEDAPTLDRWVGLFRVERYETGGGGAVAFHTSDVGLVDRAGVLYLPPGATAPTSIGVEEHLYGPWYRFVWDF